MCRGEGRDGERDRFSTPHRTVRKVLKTNSDFFISCFFRFFFFFFFHFLFLFCHCFCFLPVSEVLIRPRWQQWSWQNSCATSPFRCRMLRDKVFQQNVYKLLMRRRGNVQFLCVDVLTYSVVGTINNKQIRKIPCRQMAKWQSGSHKQRRRAIHFTSKHVTELRKCALV